MYKLDNFFDVLDKFAPLRLSHELISKGDYDNSGIIVRSTDGVSKALFALDLTVEAVKRAKRLKCDTIVTHHPAIYGGIKSLSVLDPVTAPVLLAAQNKLNVISMHLNLDIASGGIDCELARGLGAKSYRTLDCLDEANGYGKQFNISPVCFKDFVSSIKKEFNTNKIISYGNGMKTVSKCVSFCGGGSTYAEKEVVFNRVEAEVVITSDMPHHIIKELVELDKFIVLIPHYVAEEYGFRKFYLNAQSASNGIDLYYFDDKRFR